MSELVPSLPNRQFGVMSPTVNAPDLRHALDGRWFSGRGRPSEGAVWPTPRQELLLRAALLEGDAAASAWARWSTEVDWNHLDPSSIQLLPLVYRNLIGRAGGDKRLAALRPRYTVTWGQNQKLFRLLAGTLRELHAVGVPTLVVKGAALIPLYYRDSGVRGMGDFDILVPERRFRDATASLLAAGWRTRFSRPDLFDTRFDHAIAFLDAAGNSVDLHCHLLMACCEPGADDPFWEASRPLAIEGVVTRTLCATDHLIQACIHGINWVRVPPLRWVADAIKVMHGEPEGIDWDRIAVVAQSRDLALPLEATLRYLQRTFDAPVPEETLRGLADAPVSRTDRMRFAFWAEDPRERPMGRLLHHYVMYSRGVRGTGAGGHVRALPAYFRFWTRTDRVWKIPLQLGLKGVRVVGHRLGLYRYWDA
jgi:hypothetical protein